MLGFILRKMKNSRALTASLLLGNLLLFCVVAALPIYTDAILQSVMTESLSAVQDETGHWPGSVHAETTARLARGYRAAQKMENDSLDLADSYGVTILTQSKTCTSFSFHFSADTTRTQLLNSRSAAMRSKTGLEEHVEIIRGSFYADQPDSTGAVEVIVSPRTFARQDLMVGEEYEFDSLKTPEGDPFRFKVVGVFRMRSAEDPYWYSSPEVEGDVLMVSPAVFEQYFADAYREKYSMRFEWDSVIDVTELDVAEVESYAADNADTKEKIESIGGTLEVAFARTLQTFLGQQKQLSVLLLVLLMPIFAMLILFLFMVCRQILEQEKTTIAVLKSRGSSRGQVVGLYAAQSAMIGLVSAVIGIPLGFFLCRVIGASNGFLNLVSRTALPLRFVPNAFLYVAVAFCVSILTMTLPAIRYSANTIVSLKRESAQKKGASVAALIAVILVLALSLYEWYAFQNQRQAIIEASAAIDPLLYVSASVFLLGAGSLIALLLPMAVSAVFRAFESRWSAPVYAAMLRARRATTDQRFLMVFLVLTIAVGIFNATTARTINQNTEDNLRYRNGSDMVLREEWKDNSKDETAKMRLYEEPDFTPYEQLEQENGIQVAKVLRSSRYTVKKERVDVMGIDTKEFAAVAYMRPDLLSTHFYNYLNVLATDPAGVLLSENYQNLGYKLGETIEIVNENGVTFQGRIYGFFDFWPTYYETDVKTDYWGDRSLEERRLIVGNLGQMQSVWGVEPYEVWIGTKDTDAVYDFAQSKGIQYVRFTDTAADLVDEKNDPVLQGTNGVLTVGFILVLIVCLVGFLIFWILSIRSRTLQFGVFRAMGMPMRDLIALLVTEQVLVSLTSVAAGAIVGVVASRLYVPLIQMSYTAMDISLPLRIVASAGDYARLFLVFGIGFVACLAVLAVLVRRIRIAQALKLGED